MHSQAILRQEIGWFDRDCNSSETLTSMLSTDATCVKGVVTDAVGMILQVGLVHHICKR